MGGADVDVDIWYVVFAGKDLEALILDCEINQSE